MKFDSSALDSAWPARHRAALEAATRQFKTTRVDLASDHAWATTYRLVGPSGDAFLKILPPVQLEQLPRLRLLARELPESGPALLAMDAAAGWFLMADHDGYDPRTYDAEDERPAIARHFARLQVRAAGKPRLLRGLERIDPLAMPDALLAFLRGPAMPEGGSVGAEYFLGRAACERYLRLLEPRLKLLGPLLARAAALPPTIAHGDLQLRNVAMLDRREPILFDWDDVSAGPAGLCLHGLLDGCAPATVALERLERVRPVPGTPGFPVAAAMQAYVNELVRGGYATRRALREGLPGALVAGTIQFILIFGRFPDEKAREDSAGTIGSKFTELLDFLDRLACREPGGALRQADEYERDGEWRRAQRLVQDELARQDPQPIDLLRRYARLSYLSGQGAVAEEAWREVLGRDPDCAEACRGLARVLLERLELDEGERHAARAIELEPRAREPRALQRRLRTFSRLRRLSESPRGWPRVPVSAAERARGTLAPETAAMIVELFQRQGAVQVDGLYDPARIQRLQTLFLDRYREHFYDGRHPDALQVGDKRYMITVELDAEFGAPELVASSLLMPVMRRLVGEECILSAYTAVASLPGSVDQNIHRDHPAIYESDGAQLRYPAFAAQVILPLVPLNATTGATRMFKGTNWMKLEEVVKQPYQDPVVPLGSCLINDYLCPHYGRGNRSSVVRPIVTYIYTRPWFRDYLNYHKQPPLRLAPGYLEAAPKQVRSLIEWWERDRRLASGLPR